MDELTIATGLVSAVTALLTAFCTAWLTLRSQRNSLAIEKKKINLTLEQLQREHSLSYAAEKVAHMLLSDEQWRLRSFDSLKRHLGGFDDDELRRVLVCSGSIRFYSKASNTELWGLLERNSDRLGAVVIDAEPETRELD